MLRRASMLFYTNNHRHNTTFSAFMQEVFDILFQNGMPFLCSFPSFSSLAPNVRRRDGTVFFRQNHKSVPPFSQDAVHSVLCLHDIQFRDRTLFQPAQRQSALGDALQIRHRHPARGHHPPHLMVFALLHIDEALSGPLTASSRAGRHFVPSPSVSPASNAAQSSAEAVPSCSA